MGREDMVCKSDLGRWALKYADQGIAVFPLQARNKIPFAGSNGLKNATTDKKQICKWWNKYPNANIGIATGLISNLLVIDLDERPEKNKSGHEALFEWEKQNGKLPETCNVLTSRGGEHLYFRTSIETSNSTDLFENGVDIRGDGGYAVAPPSIHENGHVYEWEDDPEDVPFTEANDLVFKFISDGKKKGHALGWDAVIGENSDQKVKDADGVKISSGKRNVTIFQKACDCFKMGMSWKTTVVSLQAFNNEQCNPSLDENELMRTIKSAHNEISKRGELPGANIEEIKETPFEDSSDYNEMDFPPMVWRVEGVIPETGFGTLYAKPKLGKTWFCLQYAISVATGGSFWGNKQKKGTVIYYDFETTKRARKSRLKTLMDNGEIPEGIKFVSEIPGTIGKGFEDHLDYMLELFPDTKLVIVDTIKAIRNPKPNSLNENMHDSKEIGLLAKYVNDKGILLLATNHNKKATEEDPFDQTLGSISILGALDFILVLTQKHDENGRVTGTTLHVKGREVEEEHFRVFMKNCKWIKVGVEEDVEKEQSAEAFFRDPFVVVIQKIFSDGRPDWKGKSNDFKIEAAKYGLRISNMTNQAVGKKLINLQADLMYYLDIEYQKIDHKKNSITHRLLKTPKIADAYEQLEIMNF